MRCQRCGQENREGANYCSKCAQKLPHEDEVSTGVAHVRCPKCGHECNASANFCPNCAYHLQEPYGRAVESPQQPVMAAPPQPMSAGGNGTGRVLVDAVATPSRVAESRAVSAASFDGQMQALRVLVGIAYVLMLISLPMVWIQAFIIEGSYLQICRLLLENLGDVMSSSDFRVLGVFIPGFLCLWTFLMVMQISLIRPTSSGFYGLLVCGLFSTIASWQIYDYVKRAGGGIFDLTGTLGPGFQLYTFASILIIGLGIWGVIATSNAVVSQKSV